MSARPNFTVHPAEPLPRDELEIDALITVFGIDKMDNFTASNCTPMSIN